MATPHRHGSRARADHYWRNTSEAFPGSSFRPARSTAAPFALAERLSSTIDSGISSPSQRVTLPSAEMYSVKFRCSTTRPCREVFVGCNPSRSGRNGDVTSGVPSTACTCCGRRADLQLVDHVLRQVVALVDVDLVDAERSPARHVLVGRCAAARCTDGEARAPPRGRARMLEGHVSEHSAESSRQIAIIARMPGNLRKRGSFHDDIARSEKRRAEGDRPAAQDHQSVRDVAACGT